MKDLLKNYQNDFHSETINGRFYSSYQQVSKHSLTRMFDSLQGVMNFKKAKFLDIGAGRGHLLKFLEENEIFKCTHGVEIEKHFVDRKVCKSTIFHSDILNFDFSGYHFLYTFNIDSRKEAITEIYEYIISNLNENQVFVEVHSSFTLDTVLFHMEIPFFKLGPLIVVTKNERLSQKIKQEDKLLFVQLPRDRRKNKK